MSASKEKKSAAKSKEPSPPPPKPAELPAENLGALSVETLAGVVFELNSKMNEGQGEVVSKETVREYLESLTPEEREKLVRLMKRNIKLKRELDEVKKGFDDVMSREREKRMPKIQKKPSTNGDIQEQQEELKKQGSLIAHLKNEIKRKRAELENTFQIELLREKRNEMASLKKQLDDLKQEKELLEKIHKDQEQYLRDATDAAEEKRISELNEKLRSMKEELKTLTEEKNRLEKDSKALHANLYKEKTKLKEQARNGADGERGKKGKAAEGSSMTMAEYEEAVKSLKSELQTEKEEAEKSMRELERKRKEVSDQIAQKEEALKKLDYDFRNNSLKLKNLQRANRLCSLKPVDNRMSKSIQPDASSQANAAKGEEPAEAVAGLPEETVEQES